MADYIVDERDVSFVLFEQLDVGKILEAEKYKDFTIDDIKMIISEAIKLGVEVIGPVNAIGDEVGAQFEDGKVTFPKEFHDAYKIYTEGGWIGASASPEWGGQGLPITVSTATAEFFVGGSCSFSVTPGLTHGAANLIETFGTDEDRALYLEKMYTGQWAGTMALTEPQAGSALGDLTTSAKPIEGRKYSITGTKIFITSGEHDLTENIIHPVLARIEGAPKGMKGISLFLVPKIKVNPDGSLGEPNDVTCTNIEHKMGIHGSSTCTLNFGDDGNCEGLLLGEANQGIKAMFVMMNEARIGVGIQGMAMAAAAYQLALRYAKERIQGVEITEMRNVDAPRVAIIKHPDVRRMLMLQKAYTEGMRALLLETAYHVDLADISEDEQDKQMHQSMIELMTPICKSYCSEFGFQCSSLAMSVLGGYGYCTEYGVEQFVRDGKIATIYEGTNGIQALDLLGRKVSSKGGLYFMTYLTALNNWVDANKEHEALASHIGILSDAKDKLAEVTMTFSMKGAQDPFYPVLNASPYLDMFGNIVISYQLLQQAVIAFGKLNEIYEAKGAGDDDAKKALLKDDANARYYHNKVETAKFFATNVLPGSFAIYQSIMTENRSPLDVVFEDE